MLSHYFGIPLILFAVSNVKAINYASYRHNDTVSIDVSRDTPRTTREILEKLNNVRISSPESLQDGTEHLLQFAALLRTKILDTFGLLIYDYYDDFDMSEMYSLYRIYQDTLERKYNIFDIVPNVLLNQDLKPKAICNYINYHVRTCLKQVSYTCTKSKFPEIEQDHDNSTTSVELAKSIYDSARLAEKYQGGISLPAILEFLKTSRLHFTPELFSGLLHNIHYDDFDDNVRTAERILIHYFLTTGRHTFRKYLLKPQSIKQYNSVTKLLKGFLQSYPLPLDVKRYAEYLSEHIAREPSAISENIELLGAAYEDDSINLRYLFELVLPDDAHDSDIIDARDYLLDQMSKQNILENYLRVEKYQQSSPNQMLMGILGQLRDIDFITDIATSLQLHAKYWHSSHMIENLNQLMELFDAYENLREIPEHKKLMSTIDKLRERLTNSNNATIEMSCTRPRNCLRIGLNVIVQCNGINRETKKLISRFLSKSNFGCPNQKLMDKSNKPEDHETVSKKPIITTTRKNLEQLQKNKKPESNLTTELPVLPTKSQTKPNCGDDEPCEEDDTLATGDAKLHDANVTAELNISAQAIERETPEMTILSTVAPNTEVSTDLPTDDLGLNTVSSPVDIPTAECNNLTCSRNETEVQEAITATTLSDLDKIVTEAPTKLSVGTSTSAPLTTRASLLRISFNPELIVTTPEPIVTTSKPTCQHRDIHYRQKLRRLEKIDKSNKKVHRGDFENLKLNDVNKNTISVSATNSVVESSASGAGGEAQANDLAKFELQYGSGSNTESGQSLGKLLESLGENSKASGHVATISVESGSSHSSGKEKKTDKKKTLELLKKLQALGDASSSLGSDSSQDNQSIWHSGSSRTKAEIDAHEKLKRKLQSGVDVSDSIEKKEKHKVHHGSHSGTSHLQKILESNESVALKKKLLAGDDLLSIEDDSEHAKQKSRNKELSMLSRLKNHRSGSHHTHVMEAAESQRELSGHQETSDSTLGHGLIGSHHSRRNLGKTEEASTTEHRRKITQQYRESSRRNSKKSSSRNTTKGKSVTTSEEPAVESRHSGKHPYGALSKSNFSPNDEIIVPLKRNDSAIKGRLFDWNTPLLSNYDVALNEPEPEKVYYRPKRALANRNKNSNINVNKNDVDDVIEARLFDINLPFFSNYDVALNDKLPIHRGSRVRRDTVPVKKSILKTEPSVKKDLNSTDEGIKARLFDFNLPMGSNQKWRFNAPDQATTEPPPPPPTTQKRLYRSRRDTAKKNDTQADPKATTADPNIGKSTLNSSGTDLKPRFLDIQASIGLDGLHATTTDSEKNKSNSTAKNTTEETKGRLDISLPSLFEKQKTRKRREPQHFFESDNAQAVNENRRNVDTLFSAVEEQRPAGDGIDQRLFDFNLPMGSNQKWRFNAPEDESEKKNYRSRRNVDATATSTTSTTNVPLSTDKNQSNNHSNTNNTTIISSSTAAIELRMGNDNTTITDSNTTEKINTTTVAKQ